MLDADKQLKHISDKEIRQIILQTLLKYEQIFVMEYLQKHNRMQKITVSFMWDAAHYSIHNSNNDSIKLNLGNNGTKVAKYTFINSHKPQATINDAKTFIVNYVNKLTNKDIIAIHKLIAGHTFINSKYPNLEHNLLVWIIDNYVKLHAEGSVIRVDDLKLNGHLDDLSTYLLAKYHNNWSMLKYNDLDFISKALSTLTPNNTLLNTVILKEVNNALFKLNTAFTSDYFNFIRASAQSKYIATIPISSLGCAIDVLGQLNLKQPQPIIFATKDNKDIAKLMDFLLRDNHYNTTVSNIKYLKKHGFKFEPSGYEKVYQTWYTKLTSFPDYQYVSEIKQATDSLRIMFPSICK